MLGVLIVAVTLVLLRIRTQAGEAEMTGAIRDEAVGIAFAPPGEGYYREDWSAGGAIVHLYVAPEDQRRYVGVLSIPHAQAPKGLDSRRSEVRATFPGYRELRFEPTRLAGRDATLWESTYAGFRVIEVGVERDERLLVLQVAAPEEDWKDRATARRYQAVFDGAELWEPTALAAAPDLSTPEEVRAEREPAPPQEFRILTHDITVVVDPAKGRARIADRFEVEARKDGLEAISFLASVVTVDSVTQGGKPLEVAPTDIGVPGHRLWTVSLRSPLAAGQRVGLLYGAHADDFYLEQPNELVPEVSVLAQVRAESSYTEGVFYYPTDDLNDAPAKLAVRVPKGYVVAGGGRPGPVTEDGRTVTYHFAHDLRTPRQMPFCWAAAQYTQLSARTAGGMDLVWYGYPGEEDLLRSCMAASVKAADLFETMMGPLPWRRVAYAHVKPVERGQGVSTPGLILLSDQYLDDFRGVGLDERTLHALAGTRHSVVVDELSHQWNFYAVALPNELAEGVADFLDAYYAEAYADKETYRAYLREYRAQYLSGRTPGPDVPVASPRIYTTPAYGAIAFYKVPVVFDMLRQHLGDERFLRAWRHAFTSLVGSKADYDDLFAALSASAGEDLTWFENQWFFTAGCPRIRATVAGKTLVLEQVQPQPPFRLPALPVAITEPNGKRHDLVVELSERKHTFPLGFAAERAAILIDHDETLLVEQDR